MGDYHGSWYYEMQELGFNYRLTDFQCALGISQIRKIDRFVSRRRKLAALYRKELGHIKDIELPIEKSYAGSSWHLFVVRLKGSKGTVGKKRKSVFEYLRKNGIGAQVHYIPVYLQPYYRRLGYRKNTCPLAEEYYNRIITLPLYPSMKESDVKRVVKVLSKAITICQRKR